MRVWSATSLPSSAVLWQASSGAWSLTAVAKATFALTSGESPLAPTQEPVHTFDRYENGGALWAPTDVAPFKVRPDVVLVGSAYAPRPVASLVARLIVGGFEKAVEVHGARWVEDSGRVVEGPPFTTMPLGWERAAGGPDTLNPVGMSLDHVDHKGRTSVPHLMPPGFGAPKRGDYVEPAGFGAIPPNWPARGHLAGGAGPQALGGRWFDGPLPQDVHPAFFNVAPADQQPEYLADDPRLVLEHLSPAASRLTTTLAAVRLALYVEGGRAPGRYGMRPDTLWIDTDRQICCVTYRATVPLAEIDAGMLATILSDPPAPLTEPSAVEILGFEDELVHETTSSGDDPISGVSTAPVMRDRLPTSTSMFANESSFAKSWSEVEAAPAPALAPPPSPAPALAEGLPFRNRKPAHTRPIDDNKRTAATPFGQPPLASPPLGPPPLPAPPLPAPPLGPPPLPAPSLGSSAMGSSAMGSSAMGSQGLGAPPLAPPLVPPPPPMRASDPTTPPPVVRPMPAPPLPPPPAMRPSTPDALPLAPPPSPSQPGHSGAPQPAPAWFQQPAEPPRRVEHEARAALDGVAGASNAAARPDPDGGTARRAVRGAAERPRVTSNDVVDLVWFEEGLPSRIRRYDPWAEAVRDDVRMDEWITAEEPTEKQKDELRRFVTRALGRVPTTEPALLNRLLSESVDEEGFVDRPLVVAAGELALMLDPIEVLKSSVEIAAQLGTSEKLKEAIDASKDIAKAQRVSTPLVESLLARLRKEFVQANRSLPNDYLESTVQRTMLEERKYQRRQVLGEAHLAGTLAAMGGSTATYLPDHLASQIPVFPRFKVRIVAEPHPPQHPSDGDAATLRVLALGRVIGTRGR